MKDNQAQLLVEKRVQYNWLIGVFSVACILFMYICGSSAEGFLFVLGGSLLVGVGGHRTFVELLNSKSAYHVMSGLRLDESSGVGSVFFCIAFETLLLLFLYSFYFFDARAQC